MMRLYALVFALSALLLAAPSGGAGAAPVGAVPSTGSIIQLAVSKGTLVRLAKPASSVFIADPKIADVQLKSPSLIYVFGKAGGATTLYAVSENDEVLYNAEVQVRYDVASVTHAIQQMVPHSAITVSAVDDAVVLSGTVYSAADGDTVRSVAARFVPDTKHLINKMEVDAPNQINLRVRIAEMSRDIVKQFGIDWSNAFNNGKIAFGLITAGQALFPVGNTSNQTKVIPLIPGSPPQGGSVPAVGFNTNNTSLLGGATLGNLFGGYRSSSVSLNTLIEALDNHGLITVLAEPNLSAISGEAASFLAGGEFPVPVPAGNGVVGIEWKKFGVSLNFVATIASGDRINLHVAPEVSQLSNTGAIVIDSIQVPALTTRRAETTIELASGQSFAIAGLLQNNIAQNINKFPWLGDIPVLGQLFRSEAFQRNESELVILVTPYVVHPIATASRAQMPIDGYVPSTDGQLILHANEYQRQPATAPSVVAGRGGTSLIGPVGFELE
jgi:pilus assembly protein CpaC